MIFQQPPPDAPVDQGDIINGCPLLAVANYEAQTPQTVQVKHAVGRVVVLTQTCDLANQKVSQVVVAVVLDANEVVASGQLKGAEVRGPIRAGRVFGWYFLPRSQELGLGEMIVDFRQLHTVRLDLLRALCAAGHRPARIEPLYREHLSKHFADSYSRIGLPAPYETE
jgi:hypothetical protein